MDRKTGLPKVKNLIANGDFKEQTSLFGQIISKIKPEKPNQPPEGWEFYRENDGLNFPETETASEKPYIYVKDTALHIKAKDKGVGISQEINAKLPVYIQLNVLVISGKVKFFVLDKEGLEIDSSETEIVAANNLQDRWQNMSIPITDSSRKPAKIHIFSNEINSEWYLTNVRLISIGKFQDPVDGKSKEQKGREINESQIELFYHGKKLDFDQKNVLGATLGNQVYKLSHAFFAFNLSGEFRNNTLQWIRNAWLNDGINKEVDISETEVHIFDPTAPSNCNTTGAWSNTRVYFPDEVCQNIGFSLIVAQLGGKDGWAGAKIFIDTNGNWDNVRTMIKHELGHKFGQIDLDFIEIAGKALFPSGNSRRGTEYDDIMYFHNTLDSSQFTRQIINNGG